MGRPTDEEQFTRFRQILKQRGGTAGNYAMMTELGLKEDEYWRVRDKLLDQGEITLGRGRGGSVILVTHPPQVESEPSYMVTPQPQADSSTVDYSVEASLYQPCLVTLESHWASANRLFSFKAEVTAQQGSRNTGGIWTRPDIAAISLRTFPYWPGRHFDLWTFEIKPRHRFNVIGLFEALAHARSATQSWALYHVDDPILEQTEALDRMTSEAQRLGVGFVVFTEPSDFSTWDIRANSVVAR